MEPLPAEWRQRGHAETAEDGGYQLVSGCFGRQITSVTTRSLEVDLCRAGRLHTLAAHHVRP